MKRVIIPPFEMVETRKLTKIKGQSKCVKVIVGPNQKIQMVQDAHTYLFYNQSHKGPEQS